MATLLAAGAASLYFWATTPSTNKAVTSLYIKPGASLRAITQTLEAKGLITNGYLFQALTYGTGKKASIQAGEYAFKEAATPLEIVNKLSKGQVIVHAITIPEGLTTWQIVRLLNQDETLTGTVAGFPD